MARGHLLRAGGLLAGLALAAASTAGEDEPPVATPPAPVDSIAYEAAWRPIWETTYDERVAADPRRGVARGAALVLPYPYPIDPAAPPDWFPSRAPAPHRVAAGDALLPSGSRLTVWRVVAAQEAHTAYLADRVEQLAAGAAPALVKTLLRAGLADCALFETRQMLGGENSAGRRQFLKIWGAQAGHIRTPISFDLPVEGEWVATPAAHHRADAYSYFALDLNRLVGGRVSSADASRNEHFASWDQPVAASGDGIVTQVVDGNPDNVPGRTGPVANTVTVDYGPVSAVYAHLRNGSVEVEKGEHVHAGTVLGRVGNSGASTAPHLHLSFLDAGGFSILPRFTIDVRAERSRKWRRLDGDTFREGMVGRNLPRSERVRPR